MEGSKAGRSVMRLAFWRDEWKLRQRCGIGRMHRSGCRTSGNVGSSVEGDEDLKWRRSNGDGGDGTDEGDPCQIIHST